MTLLYYDPGFLEHDTGAHPECPERLRHILQRLEATGIDRRCTRPTWSSIGHELLAPVHQQQYLSGLEDLAGGGGGLADPDTVVSPVSLDVAKRAAGSVCDAVQRVLAGEDRRALCLVRPPGHHALENRAMGFCLLNNVALGAQAAFAQGVDRVLIFDWDVHHGNGTQAIYYNDPRVGFFSVHRWPFYPGTGSADETGTGDGLGATRNLPIEYGTRQDAYRSTVLSEVEDFAARVKPELVLISAGFDAHHSDPIGSLGLDVEDFTWLTETAIQIADTYAQGRMVSTLEGGYNPPVLADCVAAHLETLLREGALREGA